MGPHNGTCFQPGVAIVGRRCGERPCHGRQTEGGRGVKPLLLIAIRDEDDAVESEHKAILRFGELAPDELVHVRAEQADLPPLSRDDFSGIIIGGSPFNTSDLDKSFRQTAVEAQLGALVDEAIANDFPVLGICYGVGLVTTPRWDRGPPVWRVPRRGPGEYQASAFDPLFAGVPDEFCAFTGHKEACSLLPPEAVLLATGDDCPFRRAGWYNITSPSSTPSWTPPRWRACGSAEPRILRPVGAGSPRERAHGRASVGPGRILANFCARARALSQGWSRRGVLDTRVHMVGNWPVRRTIRLGGNHAAAPFPLDARPAWPAPRPVAGGRYRNPTSGTDRRDRQQLHPVRARPRAPQTWASWWLEPSQPAGWDASSTPSPWTTASRWATRGCAARSSPTRWSTLNAHCADARCASNAATRSRPA